MTKMIIISLFIIFVVLSMTGCTQDQKTEDKKDDGKDAPKNVTVTIEDFSFNPSEVTIAEGGTVKWVNEDDAAHTVVSEGFDSDEFGKGESYSFTFLTPGEVEYGCSIHPYMEGKVIVK